jgi:hypothetical protein
MPLFSTASSAAPSFRRGLAALTAFSLGLGVLTLSVVPASAAPEAVTIPIPKTQAPPYIVAASGNGAIIEKWDAAAEDSTYVASNDNGSTWTTVDLPNFEQSGATYVGAGHFLYETSDDADKMVVYRYDFQTKATTKAFDTVVSFDDLTPTVGVERNYSDADDESLLGFTTTVLSTGDTQFLPYVQRRGKYSDVTTHVGAGAELLVTTINQSSSGAAAAGYLDVVPFDGSKTLSAKVSALSAAELRGDQVIYLTTSTSNASICFRSVSAWSKPVCKVLKKGNYSRAVSSLSLGTDWVAVQIERSPLVWEYFTVGGTTAPATPAAVKAPSGKTLLGLLAPGDADRPFAYLVSDTAGSVARYEASGSFADMVDYEEEDGYVDSLQVTPGGVVASDIRPASDLPGYQVWSRSISGGVAGAEKLFAPRASSGGVNASDARSIVRNRNGIHLLDRGEYVRKLPTNWNIEDLSGGYYLADTAKDPEMRAVDGTRVQTKVSAIFGSTALKELSGNRYQVVDVTGKFKTVTGLIPEKATWGLDNAKLWGDYVVVNAENEDDDAIALVFNYRNPSENYELTGYPLALGDGYVVVNDEQQLMLWKFVEGTTTTLLASEDYSDAVGSDGSHTVAYIDGSDIVVRHFGDVGTTQPLLLGLVAPSSLNNKPTAASWKPQIDATKALGQGTLTVKDATGTVVRTIVVNPTSDGSIRDLSWNGRADDDVTPVAPGTYSWELNVRAADGSGPLARNTDPAQLNLSLITGTIKVTSKFLGTVSGSTPKIAGKAIVGQTLSVKPSTWKPAGKVAMAYQWLRNGVPIPKADEPSYTVTPGDVGAKLKVRVTGTADGWRTTTKTSGSTAKVAKAVLSPAPVPTISSQTPTVGDTLTATAGAWGPDPVALSYQWYRVQAGKRTPITDATKTTYVSVTGTKDGYASKTVSSTLTTAVAAKP